MFAASRPPMHLCGNAMHSVYFRLLTLLFDFEIALGS